MQVESDLQDTIQLPSTRFQIDPTDVTVLDEQHSFVVDYVELHFTLQKLSAKEADIIPFDVIATHVINWLKQHNRIEIGVGQALVLIDKVQERFEDYKKKLKIFQL
jgi:hypothetical protein